MADMNKVYDDLIIKTCTKCTKNRIYVKMPIAYLMESIFDEPRASGCIVGNFKKALN